MTPVDPRTCVKNKDEDETDKKDSSDFSLSLEVEGVQSVDRSRSSSLFRVHVGCLIFFLCVWRRHGFVSSVKPVETNKGAAHLPWLGLSLSLPVKSMNFYPKTRDNWHGTKETYDLLMVFFSVWSYFFCDVLEQNCVPLPQMDIFSCKNQHQFLQNEREKEN